MLWGEDARTRDVTVNLNSIVQQPACGYNLLYTPYLVTQTGPTTYDYSPLPIPNSAVFSKSLNNFFFQFQKCSEATTPFDSDCGTIDPYEINYDIIIEVTIPSNPTPISNEDIHLQVEIGNACENDVLTITQHFPLPIMYWLRTPAEEYNHQIQIQQTYSFCPYRCDLFQMLGPNRLPYPQDIIVEWYPFLGSFTVLTNDKSLASPLP